jgi:hypothetical protein
VAASGGLKQAPNGLPVARRLTTAGLARDVPAGLDDMDGDQRHERILGVGEVYAVVGEVASDGGLHLVYLVLDSRA